MRDRVQGESMSANTSRDARDAEAFDAALAAMVAEAAFLGVVGGCVTLLALLRSILSNAIGGGVMLC